jgi:hypothetical protein
MSPSEPAQICVMSLIANLGTLAKLLVAKLPLTGHHVQFRGSMIPKKHMTYYS